MLRWNGPGHPTSRAMRRDPTRALIPLQLLAVVVGLAPERLAIVLAMFVGLKGVRLVSRPGAVLVVDLPRVAAARLGLVKVGTRWAQGEADRQAERPRHRRVPLDVHVGLLADPRAREPLEDLARREEMPDRIGSRRRWLTEWERTGERPVAGAPIARAAETRRRFELEVQRARLRQPRGQVD